ncbi:MAG: VOC family protein [Myxococcota bacterium]
MQRVHIYLNFPGTTEAALTFYAEVFGTRLSSKQTFGETPWMGPVPDHARDKIMHAELPITDQVHLMASDVVEGLSPGVFVRGNDLHVLLVAADKAEADRAFARLSDGGRVAMPLGNAPWGPYFGMCVDRFGVQWMVSLPGPA